MSIEEHPPHFAHNEQIHVPVLLESTARVLNPMPGESYLDMTAGYGGHARAILERTGSAEVAVLVDRDESTREYLADLTSQGAHLMQTDFVNAARTLIDEGRQFDIVLADLGVSSPQLDQGERGFSFKYDGPLDMRMDRRQELTARDIVNSESYPELRRIIREYGEESSVQAEKIARAIIESRPFERTAELAEVVAQNYRRPWGRIHPATRTFQALRIATNHELTQLREFLQLLPQLVAPGGRVGIISFHSLEDRLVKRYFTDQQSAGYEADFTVLTKKPIRGDTEDVHNLRARSSSLRAAVKNKQK